MHRILLNDLEQLKNSYEKKIFALQKDMDNEPVRNQLALMREFNDFLKKTQGKDGARTTAKAMGFVMELNDKKEHEEQRAKTWNWNALSEEKMQYEFALGKLNNLLWKA